MSETFDILPPIFLDSFLSTFFLTFQGELALTSAAVFYDDVTLPYIVAVLAGILGIAVNYAVGYFIGLKAKPILTGDNIARYEKAQRVMNRFVIFLLPITGLSFIGNVAFLDGAFGQFINVAGNTAILFFTVMVSFFGGIFRMNFVPFLVVITVSRFVFYYLYLF